MTALAADKKVLTKDGIFESYYVKAAQQIYLGAMVCVDATTGYAYAGTNTAGRRFVGIAEENVLGVTDGVETVKVRRQGIVKLVSSGLAITDVGDAAWLTDDNTIQTTPAHVVVGTIVAVPSATEAWVALKHSTAVDSTVTDFVASGTCDVTGASTFGSTVDITGNTTVGGTLDVTGVLTTTTDCDVGGDVNCTGDLGGATATITTDATVGGTLGITGATTCAAVTASGNVLTTADVGCKGANGQQCVISHLTELTTIAAAATTSTTIEIPADSRLLAIGWYVTVTVTGCTTMDIGITGDTQRFAAGVSCVATNGGKSTGDAYDQYTSAAALLITPNTTPSNNAGRIRFDIWTLDTTAPTS